jgi:hypothetical protein
MKTGTRYEVDLVRYGQVYARDAYSRRQGAIAAAKRALRNGFAHEALIIRLRDDWTVLRLWMRHGHLYTKTFPKTRKAAPNG